MRLRILSMQLGLGLGLALGWLAGVVAIAEAMQRSSLQGLVFTALFAWGTIALRILLQRSNDLYQPLIDQCKRYEQLLRKNGIEPAS